MLPEKTDLVQLLPELTAILRFRTAKNSRGSACKINPGSFFKGHKVLHKR